MRTISRPLLLLLMEIAWLLFVLHAGASGLGTRIPASVAAITLVVGAFVIAVLLGTRRFEARAWRVEGAIGALLIASGLAAMSMSNANAAADTSLVGIGIVFVLEAVVRRRPPAA